MKLTFLLASVFSLFLATMPAQKSMGTGEIGQDHFEADFSPGGQLKMHIRSGEVRVIGSSESKITVHFTGDAADQYKDVRVSLRTSGDAGELEVRGGPRNGFGIEIQVPKECSLTLRVPFGEVRVAGIVGDKDVEVHAGDVTIETGKAADYAHVDASVSSGDLEAEPFGVSKGGLFRSFEKRGPGKYNLHAHVGAGQLTFKEGS